MKKKKQKNNHIVREKRSYPLCSNTEMTTDALGQED